MGGSYRTILKMDNKLFIKVFSEAVQTLGFSKQRNNVWIRKGEIVSECIYLQKSVYSNSYYFRYNGILNNLNILNRSYNKNYGHFHLHKCITNENRSVLLKVLDLDYQISDEKRKALINELFCYPNVVPINNQFQEETEVRNYIISENIIVFVDVLKYLNISR